MFFEDLSQRLCVNTLQMLHENTLYCLNLKTMDDACEFHNPVLHDRGFQHIFICRSAHVNYDEP